MTDATKLDLFDGTELITRDELLQVLTETEEMLDEFKRVINTHAELIAQQRFVLARFVPEPLLAKAYKDYFEARSKIIDVEAAIDEADPDTSKAN